MRFLLLLALLFVTQVAFAQVVPAPDITGVWNVSAANTPDFTCEDGAPGRRSNYVWHISGDSADGYTILVEGETGFVRLKGSINPRNLDITFSANGREDTIWFKLAMQNDGTLEGIRRIVRSARARTTSGTFGRQANGRIAACFFDAVVTATRQ